MDNKNTTAMGKMWAKFQERSTFYTGAAAMTGVALTGLYGLKSRKLRLSLYLINLRLAAQGTFVGILTVGMGYMMIKRYTGPPAVEEIHSSPPSKSI